MVMKLMNIALEGAEKKLTKQKKFANFKVRVAQGNLPGGWMVRRFRKILSEEAQQVWSERKDKIRKKKDHLSARYRPKPKVDANATTKDN